MQATAAPLRTAERFDPVSSIPFAIVHLVAIATPFITGFVWEGIILAVASYYLRMFFVTTAYHRYFAHRSFKTSRVFQFVMGFMAQTSAQKGLLWWAAHHRWHHKYSDQPEDVHSPRRGFWWSHVGWILCKRYNETDYERISDFAKYPELVWLNKHFLVPPVLYGTVLWLIGGWTWLLWGMFVSTVVLWHGTFTINSLAHVIGRVRYRTGDDSKNSLFLALITCGEGWHNNHHYYQSTANQGFFWWEVDFSYYALRMLSWFGIVWDLRTPPRHVLETNRVTDPEPEDAETVEQLAA